MGLSSPSRAADGHLPFLHSAAVLASRAEMLDVSARFVDEGLRAGDLTVLATAPETAEEIRRRLGGRADALEDDARIGLLGARAPDGVAAVRHFVERAASSRS